MSDTKAVGTGEKVYPEISVFGERKMLMMAPGFFL